MKYGCVDMNLKKKSSRVLRQSVLLLKCDLLRFVSPSLVIVMSGGGAGALAIYANIKYWYTDK